MADHKPADCLTKYYRCAEKYVRRIQPTQCPNGRTGYFLFGSSAVCYGTLDGIEPRETPEASLEDSSKQVKLDTDAVRLPFDPNEVIENLHTEKYIKRSGSEASSIAAAAYYLLRPLLPVGVRKHLQRFRLRDWEKLPFPNWPIDHSVENLLEQLMLLALRASGAKRIPFVWFWPEGHSSCAIMSHDVETARGRDYCRTLMDIDDSFGIKASFQVVPEKRYQVTPEFLESIRHRGFEVVIHDLNHDGRLFNNYEQFLQRAAKINAYGKSYKADGFRAAVLYRRQQWFDALNFSYDMSVPNVARLDPQRGGCCTVMPYFIGDMLEIPVTMVQDYTLFNILNRHSIDLWQEQMETVMEKHGLMSFIIHPDFINGPRERKVYESLLEYLTALRRGQGVWMTTPGEVNRWWRQRDGMTLIEKGGGWQIEGAGRERARVAYACERDGRLVVALEELASAGVAKRANVNGNGHKNRESEEEREAVNHRSVASENVKISHGRNGSQHHSIDFAIAVVGAGPYGLSAAAHLRSRGFEVRVFGQPMEFWETKMPTGMLLRSPRVASTISDPCSSFTLEAYESATGTEVVERVHRETFVDYGKWFQKQAVCDVDRRSVVGIRKEGEIFAITLSDGTAFKCRRVIVAAGVGPFKRVPAPFSQLTPSLVSHCYDGRDLRNLGRRVAVIGAGQSALESAALLQEAEIEVEVIAKIPALRWIGMHKRLHQLGIVSQMLYSKHDIGPIGISRLVAYPNLMYHLPLRWKDPVRKRAVRPAGAPWLIPRLQEVRMSLGRTVVDAREVQGGVQLILDDGSERRVDHVLLGTGYNVEISKYEFLSPELLNQVRQIEGYPNIGDGFESSVPGLHFIGAAAARKFGPLLYFVTGTDFSSRELASFISRN